MKVWDIVLRAEQGLALVALILGIVGGVFLIGGGVRIFSELLEGSARLHPEMLLVTIVGVLAIVASVVIWTGRYVVGGSINIILGVFMVVYGEAQQGLIILISGIVGIVAPKIRD